MQTDSWRKVLSTSTLRAPIPILLIGLLSILILNNYLWLRLDHAPLTLDEADHFSNSVSYYRWLWQSTPQEELKFYEFVPFPPLVGLLTHLVFPFFGFNAHAAILFIQSLFAIVLMFALYGVTRFLCPEPEAGVTASLLVFLYPVTFVMARQYLLDLPLAAMSTLSMFLLFRVYRFRALSDALLLGLALGLGMLTKWSFAFYLAVPVVIVLFKMLVDDASHPHMIHVSVIILVALLVSACWYGPTFRSNWTMLKRSYAWGAHRSDLLWTQPSGLLFYLDDLIFQEISPLGFLFLVLGVLFFLRKKINLERGLILAWILAPMIILTLIRYKSPRYALPYIPAMAIISVVGLYEMKGKFLRTFLWTAFVVLLVAQYYALSFTQFIRPQLRSFRLFRPEQVEFFSCYPRNLDWKVDEVLEELTKAFKRAPSQKKVVFVLSHHEIYNANTFNCLSNIGKLGIWFIGAAYVADPMQVVTNEGAYILLKESSLDTFFNVNRERIGQAINFVQSHPLKYTPVRSLYLPDGSLATLYSNDSQK